MNTEQIKEINTLLALIEAEMGRIRVMMREAPEQTDSSSSELPNNSEPNPYAVDWSNAPDWADVHCWDKTNFGYWYGTIEGRSSWIPNLQLSGHNLPDGLDWNLSKTTRPC